MARPNLPAEEDPRVAEIIDALNRVLPHFKLGNAELLGADWNICRRAYEVAVKTSGRELVVTVPEVWLEEHRNVLDCRLGEMVTRSLGLIGGA